ncbi:DMT family transporter [Streptomyces puniciscabiei]
MRSLLCVTFSLLTAVSNATATVLQRHAARRLPASNSLRLTLMKDLLRRAAWVAGMGAVVIAACFQGLALSAGPLSMVQPILALELPLALLIGGWVLGRPTSRRAWAATVLTVAGLGTALTAAAPTANATYVPADRWIITITCGCGAMIVLTFVAVRRSSGNLRAALFGTAAAIGYAFTAALMKAAIHTLQRGGVVGFFSTWETYAFAAAGLTSVFLLSNAMQSGPLSASQPTLTVGDTLMSVTLGVTLYGEHIRTGWWLLPEILGAAAMMCGGTLLCREPLTSTLAGPVAKDAAQPQSESDVTYTSYPAARS